MSRTDENVRIAPLTREGVRLEVLKLLLDKWDFSIDERSEQQQLYEVAEKLADIVTGVNK